MLHGRTDEARAIIDRYLGGEEHMAEADYGSETKNEAGWRQLFAPGMRSRTFFVCTFYIVLSGCQARRPAALASSGRGPHQG